MVETKIIPSTRVPELAIVFSPISKDPFTFPVIASYIVLYIPAPGTSGIKQHIIRVVTGVFNNLANISEYILKHIDDINNELILDNSK